MLTLILGSGFFLNQTSPGAYISIISFMVVLNLTSITLAYGIKQRTTLNSLYHFERKIKHLNHLIKGLSHSHPSHLWILEDRQFNKRFLRAQRELINLIDNKTRSLNWREFIRRLPIIRLFLQKLRPKQGDYNYINFPKEMAKIKVISDEISVKTKLATSLKKHIKALKERETPKQQDILGKIKQYDGNIEDCEAEIDHLNDEVTQTKTYFNQLILNIQNDLKEGYILGLWYVEHVSQINLLANFNTNNLFSDEELS